MKMLWKLYYDAGCNLCHNNKLKAERWAERTGQALEALPLQSEEGLQKGYGLHDMVLVADKEYIGADAWLKLLTLAPWYLRWLAPLRLFPPTNWLAKLGYRFVAAIRYKIWGRRACEIPKKA